MQVRDLTPYNHPTMTTSSRDRVAGALRHQRTEKERRQRDRTVNRVQGDSLREAAQKVRREEEEEDTGTETRCPNQIQADPDPFVETTGPTTEPFSEPEGETQEMELS